MHVTNWTVHFIHQTERGEKEKEKKKSAAMWICLPIVTKCVHSLEPLH